jgi:HEPN domain-containing protein
MASCEDLKKIAKTRIEAVKLLIQNNDHDGAVYLSGHALECALKSVICKRLNLDKYPDRSSSKELQSIFLSHRLDVLLTLSGMEKDFSLAISSRRSENWSEFINWNVDLRYEPIGTRGEAEAKRKLEALVEDPDGIITFMEAKSQW